MITRKILLLNKDNQFPQTDVLCYENLSMNFRIIVSLWETSWYISTNSLFLDKFVDFFLQTYYHFSTNQQKCFLQNYCLALDNSTSFESKFVEFPWVTQTLLFLLTKMVKEWKQLSFS